MNCYSLKGQPHFIILNFGVIKHASVGKSPDYVLDEPVQYNDKHFQTDGMI